MTNALANNLAVDTPTAEQHGRRKKGDPLDEAYVVSGGVDPTAVITGATLDHKREYGAIAVTIARELVYHQFPEHEPFYGVVVRHWFVAAERIGQANASLGAGVTSLSEETGLIGRVRWIGRVALEEQVRDLLACGEVREARELVESTPAVELDGWRSLLRPPSATVRPAQGEVDTMENYRWLKEYAAEYAGQWIALKAGELLAADLSRAELTRKLRVEGRLAGAFLVCLKN
jgi:hypothetical protein